MVRQEFEIGDTVRLKSGGPIMTIEKSATYRGEFKLCCTWFDGVNQLRGAFPVAVLQKIEMPL